MAKRVQWVGWCGLGLWWGVGLGSAVWAQAPLLQLERVEVHPGHAWQVVLWLDGEMALEDIRRFALASPARQVLDLPHTRAVTEGVLWSEPQGVLRQVQAVTSQSQDTTRVVLDMTRLLPQRVSVHDHRVVIDGIAPQQEAAASAWQACMAVEDVDFRRGAEGQGQVVMEMAGLDYSAHLQVEGDTVRVHLGDVCVPQRLQRRLDVLDFGTPVHRVDLSQQQRDAVLTLHAKGAWDASAHQVDHRFVVDVRPVQLQGPRQADPKQYTGKRLSLNFQQVDVRSALQLIADFTDLNVVVSDAVTGTLALRLHDVPWDEALDIILKSKGLDKRIVGKVMLVGPASDIAEREKLALEAEQQVASLVPLRSEFMQINYAKAEDLSRLLKDDQTSLLSERGHVATDPRTNTLMVHDVPERLSQIRAFIGQLDRPVKQVMIEARVVRIKRGVGKSLGLRWGLSGAGNISRKTRLATAGTQEAADSMVRNPLDFSTSGDSSDATDTTLSNRLNVALPAGSPDQTYGGSIPSFALALAKLPAGTLIDLELSALESESLGEVVSSPRLITTNQSEATIEQGTELPYQESSSSGATSVSFKKAVLSLKVRPQITPDGRIILNLTVNKDAPTTSFGTTSAPAISTNQITTQVLVDNGETLVLGGIYNRDKENTLYRVPFLGDLPMVGALFRSSTKTDARDELIVFITPRILLDPTDTIS